MSYVLFMVLAMVSAAIVARCWPHSLALLPAQRWFIGLAGFSAAILFAKLPFLVLRDDVLQHAGTLLMGGKSILFGLVGGYAGVELAKKYLGVTTKTGDAFVVPVAVGVGVGRWGCFFAGCCYGVPTEMPWGIVFAAADSVARHPIQIYESVFHLSLAGLLAWLRQAGKFPGQLIKVYFLSYFVFRWLTEFIRPEIAGEWGLTVYQWSILVFMPVFLLLWHRDAQRFSQRATQLDTH